MYQPYTRKSVRDSLTNNDLIILENFRKAYNERNKSKAREKLQKVAKQWDKLVYTFCILFNYLHYGICQNLFPPAVVDMKFLYRTSMAKIMYGHTFGGAGYLTGSLTGFLYKYINRQLSFIVNTVIFAIFIAAEPIWSNIYLFYLSVFCYGFGSGVWDSGNSVWVVEMWKENSPPVLQLSQMMYGCGAIIGPLLVEPYIYGDLSNKTDINSYSTNTVLSNSTMSDDINYSVDRQSNLKIPFFIAGSLSLTIPIVLLVMFFIKRYKIPETQTIAKKLQSQLSTITEDNSANKDVELSPRLRKILIGLLALTLTSYLSLEMLYFSYSSTYHQYLPIHLSASTAAQVMSVMTATYAVGRGVSAFIASKLRPEVMLSYHFIILLVSYAVLYFGQHSEAFIFMGNALIGFGFSAIWPSFFAFSERYIKLTDRVTSIFAFTSMMFIMAAPFILGPLIEDYPQIFISLEIGIYCIVVILFIINMVIVKRTQRFPISYTFHN